MPHDRPSAASRRDFLTGNALRKPVEPTVDVASEEQPLSPPVAGDTVRLQTRAMACEFAVILNPDFGDQIPAASESLDLVHGLEQQMTVYRNDSEMSRVNRRASRSPVEVEPALFDLLRQSIRIAEETGGAFDPTTGPLIALWRACRAEHRIPTPDEIADAKRRMGIDQVVLDDFHRTVRYLCDGFELNLGGIGKGFALDRIADDLEARGFTDFLLHGGHSSMIARGDHHTCVGRIANPSGDEPDFRPELGRIGNPSYGGSGRGWPVGIRDPLFPGEDFATLLLKDRALSSSGSGVQSFRHEGKRYGHILDPRTGLPSEGMLSVTVLAPTAAEADALSTAFFVMGLEKARAYCDNRREIGAVLVPPPQGRSLRPVLCNIGEGTLFFEQPAPHS
jgi:FAD:protein FMN transferase